MLRRVIGALIHFVRGMAQTVTESRRAAADTGVSDQEWWSARSALLLEFAPDFAERFPASIWLESAGACDETTPYLEREAKKTFQAGLTVILDGIEAIRSRHIPTRGPVGPESAWWPRSSRGRREGPGLPRADLAQDASDPRVPVCTAVPKGSS